MQYPSPDEPCYVISIAAQMVNLHPQTLRYYERIGLVVPARSRGNIRLYSQRDIERLQKISRLTNELGVNLAGVEVIMHLTDTIERMQAEMDALRASLEAEIERLRQRLRSSGIAVDEE
ncbi:MAG: helix-turn-helix transcriptional regulator [Chloroflexi bacterium]|nr:helix-turn-helix transcriptional regulator [Chloroflexota bacterium]